MPRVIGMSYNQFLVRPGHKSQLPRVKTRGL